MKCKKEDQIEIHFEHLTKKNSLNLLSQFDTILKAFSIQFDISIKNSMMNPNIYSNIINIDISSHI